MTILDRFLSKTPNFFKRMQVVGISLSALGTSLVSLDNIPEKFLAYGEKAIWIGGVIVLVSQFAVDTTKKNPK